MALCSDKSTGANKISARLLKAAAGQLSTEISLVYSQQDIEETCTRQPVYLSHVSQHA